MIKIIEHGKKPETTRWFVCTFCACVFDADKKEYEFRFFFDRNETYICCKCPECGHMAYSDYQT